MGVFPSLIFLAMGSYIIFLIFDYETRKFKAGTTNHYLKVRRSFCSEEDFKIMLRTNVLKSVLIRFVAIGILLGGFCIYAFWIGLNDSLTPEMKAFSFWDIFVIWVTASMMAMSFRAINAMYGAAGLPR